MDTFVDDYIVDPDIFQDTDTHAPSVGQQILDEAVAFKQDTERKLKLNDVTTLLTGAAHTIAAGYKGDLAKLVRNLRQDKKIPKNIGDALASAYTMKYDDYMLEALQPLSRLGGQSGKDFLATIARRTKLGVCYDANCILEKAFKKHRPDNTTFQVVGRFNNDSKYGHAILLSGTKKSGYTILDPINKIESPGRFVGFTKDEVLDEIQTLGLSFGTFIFKGYPPRP